ncbi:MAG: cytochrome-c peroxidase [Rhodobacteraceae bacterium]|nr:cytochrome-c peroxidase [Paracoccaceae bacterium]
MILCCIATLGVLAAGVASAEGMPVFPQAVFSVASDDKIALGQLLFYEPILSGNKNIACATCHNPEFGTSDGVSLTLGEGGIGLGPKRRSNPDNLPEQRVGRNAPALFNLGAAEFTSMFHDGRLELDDAQPSGIRTPLDAEMVEGFDSILSAQAMFPVLSGDEMAGQYSENDVSKAVRKGFLTQKGGAWDIIASRVAGTPEYRQMFDGVIGQREIRFTDISNMIASFVAFEWRADDSPFDRYLNGQELPEETAVGLELFYGKAGCSTCHSGRFQTDQNFYAIAMPQIGPGKAARFENHHRDVGRIRVTGQAGDAYKFRTPSLRNIAATGPYGHDGAYATLEGVVRHHLDPINSLNSYDRSQAILPDLASADDWTILESPVDMAAIASANELEPIALDDTEVDAILAFLQSLSDETSLKGRLGVPDRLPSGLPVD